MRTRPIPAFQAALEEPILCAFEAQPASGAFHREVRNFSPLGRKAVTPRVEYYYRQLKALPRRLRRMLQRRYARSLAGVALLLALGQAPTLAATITVGGGCTLVDAITAANSDLATGGCPAGNGVDFIELTSDVTLTTVDNTTDGANGLPSVTSPMTLNGNGHTLQRSTVTGTPEFRLLHVADTGSLTLNQITLRNGRAPYVNYYSTRYYGGAVFSRGTVALNDSTVSGNSANLRGGGVFNGSGATLTVTDSTVSGNSSADYYGFYGRGGGLSNLGTLTLTNSTVAGNTAGNRGGGVYNGYRATLTNSTVSGNSVLGSGFGGGVFNGYGATLTVTDSTVSGNSGGNGSVFNRGTLTLTNSTVSGNTAIVGGGVTNEHSATLTNSTVSGNSAGFYGGGVSNGYGATLTVTDSTVSGNSTYGTYGYGGGLHNFFGTLTLTNSTVAGNTAGNRGGGVYNRFGTLTLARSLISGNTSPAGMEVYNHTAPYDTETVTANNFNLFGVNGDAGVVGFTPGPTDIIPAAGVMLSDILNPLADNGGPTQTHALVVDGPALDASPIDKDCAATDQRGVFRPQGSACDIGAFEVVVEPDPFALPTPTSGCTVNGVPDQLCRGTSGPDRILGTAGNDVIVGLTGDDYLNGSGGENRLFGGEDNDRLIGSKGDDQLLGQTGDDDLRGFAGDDVLDGGDGNDRLKGHEGNDQLRGGNGDDALRGLEGQDTLEGGAGTDLLRGGADPDTVNGGPGTDTLNGGGGFDFCTSDAEDKLVVLCE